MKRVLAAVAVLAGLVVAAVVGIAVLVPPEEVEREIVRQVRNNTGWNLRVDGAIDIGVLPSITLDAQNVGLSGRAWADGIEFVSADRVSFGLAILPLVTGNVEVSAIRFENPIFVLEIDADGRTSWDPVVSEGPEAAPESIEDVIAQSKGEAPPAPRPAAEPQGPSHLPIRDLSVSRLEIVGGTLAFRDRRSGTMETIEAVDITASVPSLDDRSEIAGSLKWRGETVTLSGGIGELRSLIENTVSELSLKAESAKARIALEGRVSAGGETQFEGTVAASAPSLPDLARWATGGTASVPEVGPVSLATPLVVGRTRISADAFSLKAGEANGTGSLDVALDGARPFVRGRFTIDRLDLDSFVKADARTVAPPFGARRLRASLERPFQLAQLRTPLPNPRRGGSSAAPPAAAAPPRAPAVPAATAAGSIDFAPLMSADADLAVSVGEIVAAGVTARDVAFSARLQAGRLAVDLAEAQLFGGRTGGSVVLDAGKPVPSVKGSLKAGNLDLAALATLAGHADPLAGALSIDARFRSAGRSTAELVGALDAEGTASLAGVTVGGLPLADLVGDPAAGEVRNVDATLRFAGRDRPVTAEGSAQWRGETFGLTASATPAPLALGRPAPVSVKVSGQRLVAGYDGSVSPSGAADGAVSLSTPSLRGLLSWLNQPVPSVGGLGSFDFTGRLSANGDTIAFKDASIGIDGTTATGSGTVRTGGAKPSLDAALTVARLDLTPYLAPGAAPAAAAAQPGAPASAAPAPAGGGQVAAAANGWSQEPIDLSGLAAADAKLSLVASEIVYDRLKVGPAELAVNLSGGKLVADINRLGLYQGSGTGQIVAQGGAGQWVSVVLRIAGVNAYPFLRDAAGFDKIEGTGDLGINLNASGTSPAGLVSTLAGEAGFQFRDGAIRGINIPRMVRGLATDILKGWNQAPTEKTDFSSLSGSFQVANGVAVNRDLAMIGPLVRVKGAGTTSVPQRTLAWRVEPEVVATLVGQGREGEFAGFGVPVVIEGSWDSPRIYPDIAGILQNPAAAYEQLRALGGGIFGGAPDAAGVKQKIQEETGIDVDTIVKDGKIDKDAAVDQAVKGLFDLLGKQKR